jgi:hypothetical protein
VSAIRAIVGMDYVFPHFLAETESTVIFNRKSFRIESGLSRDDVTTAFARRAKSLFVLS